jgi:D-xylose transport system substrate-binding protein
VKKFFAVFALTLSLFAAAGCNRATGALPAATAKPSPEPRRIKIGFSIATDTFIIERWNKDTKIFSDAARDLGAEVIVQLSAGGVREQIAQLNYLLTQKVDVLVVVAHDTNMLAGAVRQARDAGVPVVAYDRLIMGVPIDAFISFDNREVGALMGQALTARVPRGRYLVVNGSLRDSNSFEVNAGLYASLRDSIDSGRVTVLDDIWLSEWSSDEALEKLSKALDQYPRVDAISCANDQIASAAYQLLSERRLAGTVALVGQDADLVACQRVVEGTQLMSVYKPIAKLAQRAARLAIALAKKESLPYDRLMDNQSGAMIPTYIETALAVYRSNMESTVIKDGFHSAADVYRNLAGPGEK